MGARADGRYDVIVVGVGAMGSAACWRLARRGVRVLGLDRYGIPNAQGSSHGESRAIRLAYHEHPAYVPLLRRAYALWAELEAASGEKLLHVTGGLYLGPPGAELVHGAAASARLHGLEHELLDAAQVARRWPQFRLPRDYEALYEPAAGLLRPEAAVSAQAAMALRSGAELHGHEPATSWEASPAGATVSTGRAVYQADRVVFCGGPWTGTLLADLGVPLTVTRQVMGWVWPRRSEHFALGAFPTWLIEADGAASYGFPMLPGGLGLKVASHVPGPPVDADADPRRPAPDDEATFRPVLRAHIPDADGPLLAMRVCLYTMSPDAHFVVDRHPGHANAVVACGFSGHGFKFAPVIGEALADLAQTGRTSLPIGFLSLSRFAR